LAFHFDPVTGTTDVFLHTCYPALTAIQMVNCTNQYVFAFHTAQVICSVSIKQLALRPASEITRTDSGGAQLHTNHPAKSSKMGSCLEITV